MNFKKVLIYNLITISLLTSNINAYSQNKNIATNYSSDVTFKLNNDLEKQDYTDFFSLLKNNIVSDESYIQFLNAKKDEGHVPIFWLLSDYYAKKNDIINTKKWLYIAIITTNQDYELCIDKSAKYANQKLTRYFNTSFDIDVKSPEKNKQAIQDAILFITNMKKRAHPRWVCLYGDHPVILQERDTIQREMWQQIYAQVLNKYSDSLLK